MLVELDKGKEQAKKEKVKGDKEMGTLFDLLIEGKGNSPKEYQVK